MTEEKYKKLNQYLNLVFKTLEIKDSFLIENMDNMVSLNYSLVQKIESISFQNDSVFNKMTWEDVYLCAREIIGSINETYLKEYDTLIKSGKLDFNYENMNLNSQFIWENQLINITRKFNYSDVVTLVHEFFHMTNFDSSRITIYRYLLTEFFSIYFETYAIHYLLQKGISQNEIDIYFRLRDTKIAANRFSWYGLVMIAYKNFGNIDEKSIDLLNEYYVEISKEQFEEECLYVFNKFQKIEETFYMKKNNSEKELGKNLTKSLSNYYRYILGTLMAFYAYQCSDMKDIVFLNNHINDSSITAKPFNEVLNMIYIDITNPDFNDELLSNLEEILQEIGKRKL